MNSSYASEKFKDVIWKDYITRLSRKTTVKSYESAMDEIMDIQKKDILDIRQNDADQYFEYLKKKESLQKIKSSTVATKIRWAHSVFSFLEENKGVYGIITEDYFKKFLDQIEKVSTHAQAAPLEDIDKILQAAQVNLMDYCVLLMLFRVGLTTMEVADLRPQQISSYENGTYLMMGEYPRLIPNDVTKILDTYYGEREECEFLFYNKKKERLNRMYFTRMIKKYSDEAGVPAYSCRTIRGTCGVVMYAYGVKADVVAKQMGVTTKHIRRYNNQYFKEKELMKAGSMVKLQVSAPE